MNAARLKLARLCIDQALAEWQAAQELPPMREDALRVAARADGRHEVKTVAGEVLAVCATNAEAWGWMTGGATKGEGIRISTTGSETRSGSRDGVLARWLCSRRYQLQHSVFRLWGFLVGASEDQQKINEIPNT